MEGVVWSLVRGLANSLGDAFAWLRPHLSSERLTGVVQAAVTLVIGLVLVRVARFAIDRSAKGLTAQQRMLLRRTVSYALLSLFVVSALRELGFDFGVLLGAAGVITVALGFASQTSASNVISGLFLVLEQPFEVGSVIRVAGVTGEVLSIDLLSTKIRTFDNLMVRIPNETMVKSEITNLNRFPIRRVDMTVGVAYKEDLAEVQRVLLEVADRNPLALADPAPLLIAQGFGASSIDYQLSVWAKTENWLELKNRMQQEVKAAFDAHGIEIPFPHLSLYAGSVTDPFPVRRVAAPPDGAPTPAPPEGAPHDDPAGTPS